jgi:hypothetical protein
MGDAAEKLSGKLGIDTTDFKTGISAANRELRVLETSFKANAAALGDWTKDASGLELRIESLTKKMDIQRLKVAALKENYELMVTQNGANSRAAQDAAIKLNQETEQLNKMQNELTNSEQALAELNTTNQNAGDVAVETGGKFQGFKGVIGGIGTIVKGSLIAISAMMIAVAGLGASIGRLVFDTASASAELVDLSAKTGITTTRLQELKYVGDQVGTSQDTIVSSLARLTRSMGDAQQQQKDYNQARADAIANGEEFTADLGDSAAAFEKLGVKTTDAFGNLRDNEAVFADLITALGKVLNEGERDVLTMSLFGKSAQELNPLIKAGSAEMARLSQEAHNVGAVMSEENVAAFEAFDDTLASLQAGLKGTLGTFAAIFLPGFQAGFNQLGGYLKKFSAIIDASDGDLGKIAQGAGGLVTQMVKDIAAQAPQLLQTGVTILQSIVQAILNALPAMIPAAISIITTLLKFLIDNLPLIVDAGLKAIIALAKGLGDALPVLIPAIIEALITIVNTIVENVPLLVDAALQLILGLTKGLLIALPILIAALPEIIQAILDALVESGPQFFEMAGELLGMLATGIIAAIPVVILAIAELITRLGVTLGKFFQTMPYYGKQLLAGIWKGIVDNAGEFFNNLKNFFSNMVENIQDQLGIHSPSTVMEDKVGPFLMPGVTKGVEKSIPRARQQLEAAIGALTNNLQLNLPGIGVGGPQLALAGVPAGAAGAGSVSNTSNQSVVINIAATVRSQQDIDYLAQEVAKRIAS